MYSVQDLVTGAALQKNFYNNNNNNNSPKPSLCGLYHTAGEARRTSSSKLPDTMTDQFSVSEATEGQAGTSAVGVDTRQRPRKCGIRNSNFPVSFL